MKLATLPLVGLLAFSSCLEMEQTITLRADGSGVQKFSMTMRETTIVEVKHASALAQPGAATDPTVLFDKEKVERELVAAGLTMTAHEASKAARKRSVKLEATFGDFATLQKTPLGGTQAEWSLTKGPKEGTARLTVYPQGKEAWALARKKAKELEGKDDPLLAQFFVKRKQQLAGLDLALRFELPGDVYLYTKNMKKVDDRVVEARVTEREIRSLEDMVRRLAPRYEVIFDCRACTLPLAEGK